MSLTSAKRVEPLSGTLATMQERQLQESEGDERPIGSFDEGEHA